MYDRNLAECLESQWSSIKVEAVVIEEVVMQFKKGNSNLFLVHCLRERMEIWVFLNFIEDGG